MGTAPRYSILTLDQPVIGVGTAPSYSILTPDQPNPRTVCITPVTQLVRPRISGSDPHPLCSQGGRRQNLCMMTGRPQVMSGGHSISVSRLGGLVVGNGQGFYTVFTVSHSSGVASSQSQPVTGSYSSGVASSKSQLICYWVLQFWCCQQSESTCYWVLQF